MNIRERVRGAMRRVGEVSLRDWLSTNLFAGRDGRRTAGAGSNLAPFSSPSFARAGDGSRHTIWCRSLRRRICGGSRRRRWRGGRSTRLRIGLWGCDGGSSRGRAGAGADSGWSAADTGAHGKLRGAESRRFVPLAGGAGAGGCDRWWIWGDRTDLVEGWTTADCRRDADASRW